MIIIQIISLIASIGICILAFLAWKETDSFISDADEKSTNMEGSDKLVKVKPLITNAGASVSAILALKKSDSVNADADDSSTLQPKLDQQDELKSISASVGSSVSSFFEQKKDGVKTLVSKKQKSTGAKSGQASSFIQADNQVYGEVSNDDKLKNTSITETADNDSYVVNGSRKGTAINDSQIGPNNSNNRDIKIIDADNNVKEKNSTSFNGYEREYRADNAKSDKLRSLDSCITNNSFTSIKIVFLIGGLLFIALSLVFGLLKEWIFFAITIPIASVCIALFAMKHSEYTKSLQIKKEAVDEYDRLVDQVKQLNTNEGLTEDEKDKVFDRWNKSCSDRIDEKHQYIRKASVNTGIITGVVCLLVVGMLSLLPYIIKLVSSSLYENEEIRELTETSLVESSIETVMESDVASGIEETEPVETSEVEYEYDVSTIVSDNYSEPTINDLGEVGHFHVPCINLTSTDAMDVNAEINNVANNNDVTDINYSVICVDDTIFSLIIDYSYYGWSGFYKAYTFDVSSGRRLTNDDILAYCGIDVDSFYEQAHSATCEYLNSHPFMGENIPVIVNDDINPEWTEYMNNDSYGMGETAIDLVANNLSQDALNSEMGMFLDSDGRVAIWQPFWAVADSHDCEVFYEIPYGDLVSIIFDNGAGVSNANDITPLADGVLLDGDYRAYDYSFAEDGLSGIFSIAVFDVYTAEEAEEYSSSRVLPDGQILDEYNHFELQDNGSYYLLEFDGALSTYLGEYELQINPDVVIYDNVDPFYSPWDYYDFTEQIGSIQDFENLRADENTYDPNPSLFIRISDGEICLIVINPDCHQGWRNYSSTDDNSTSEVALTMEQAHESFANYFESICYQYDGQDPQYYYDVADSDNSTCVYQFRYYWGAQAYYSIFYYMDLETGYVRTQEYEEIPDGSAATPSEGSEEVMPGIWFAGAEYNVFNAWDYL